MEQISHVGGDRQDLGDELTQGGGEKKSTHPLSSSSELDNNKENRERDQNGDTDMTIDDEQMHSTLDWESTCNEIEEEMADMEVETEQGN